MLIAKCDSPFCQIHLVDEFGRFVYQVRAKLSDKCWMYLPSITFDEAMQKARRFLRSHTTRTKGSTVRPPSLKLV